jgi:transglutaminase-like putative cysteine protease
MLRPLSNPLQYVSGSTFSTKPNVPVDEHEDARGNLVQRLIAPACTEFSVRASAEVRVHPQQDVNEFAPFTLVQYLPAYVLEYLLPSRYCESDRFGALANEITSGLIPGYQQVKAICEWVSVNVRYLPGTSNHPVSASEVNMRGSGVCRDLAHLAIALCRGLSIPARMVAGFLYGLEPMDLHTWIEVYLDGAWYRFDPVKSGPGDHRVVLGYGRDAADVAVFNQFGATVIPATMDVAVDPLAEL